MTVQEPWQMYISTGLKTVEGRVGPFEKHAPLVGQEIEIHNGLLKTHSDYRSVVCLVLSVVHYDTLDEYLKGEHFTQYAPQAVSAADAKILYSLVEANENGQKYKVFSEENVAKNNGINALRLRLIR